MKKLILSVAALGLLVLPAYATQGIRENAKYEIARAKKINLSIPKRGGIVRFKSPFTVEETIARFREEVGKRPLNIIAEVNHQANAESVNLELRPTFLFIFGNPRVGTPLMQCNQTTGIDLPQKALIWEDENGEVWLGYNSPKFLNKRHRLRGCADEALETVGNALRGLAEATVTP